MSNLHCTNVTIKTDTNTNIQLCNSTKDQIRVVTEKKSKYSGDIQITQFVNVEDLAKALDSIGYKLEAKQ